MSANIFKKEIFSGQKSQKISFFALKNRKIKFLKILCSIYTHKDVLQFLSKFGDSWSSNMKNI